MAFTATDLMIEVLPADDPLRTGEAETPLCGQCTETCTDCTKCSGCSSCSDCTKCTGCSGCTGCTNCSKCTDCTCTQYSGSDKPADAGELAALERDLELVVAGR